MSDNLLQTKTKYCYKHLPTNKWVHLYESSAYTFLYGELTKYCHMILLDDFNTVDLFDSRETAEKLLLNSHLDGKQYAKQNPLEFELKEIRVNYYLES